MDVAPCKAVLTSLGPSRRHNPKKTAALSEAVLPLLGSNQDSPDPEGAVKHPEFPRLRVTRCWSLLGFMLDFAVLYSLKCESLPPFEVYRTTHSSTLVHTGPWLS